MGLRAAAGMPDRHHGRLHIARPYFLQDWMVRHVRGHRVTGQMRDSRIVRQYVSSLVVRVAGLAMSLFLLPGSGSACSYAVALWQTEGRATGAVDNTNSLRLHCHEDELCRGDIRLSVDGASRIVSATALFHGGYLFLKLRDGQDSLFIGSQPYVEVPTGIFCEGHGSIIVSETPGLAAEDSPNRLLHKPILRKAEALATLGIEIRGSD